MAAEVHAGESMRWRHFLEVLESGWVFRWQTLALYALIGIPFSSNSEFPRLHQPSLLTAVGVSTFAVATTIALIVLIGWTRRLVSFRAGWLVVLGLSGIGATRGWLTTLFVDSLGLNDSSYLDSRVVLSSAAVPVLVIVSAFIVATIARGQRERASTKRTTAALRRERDDILAEITRGDEILITQSEGTLRPQIDQIRQLLSQPSHASRGAIADALDNLIATVVRPLSHQLAANARTHHQSTDSIGGPIASPIFPSADSFIGPLVTSATVFLTTVVIFFDSIPISDSLLSAALGALITWLVLRSFQALLSGLTLGISFILTVVFLAHVGTALLVAWVDVTLFGNNRIGLEILIALSAASLVPGLSYVAQRLMVHLGAIRLSELAAAQREMSIDASEVRRRAWLRQRHIAHALHSAIQSRVNAESRLVRTGTGPLSRSDCQRIEATLDEIFAVLRNTDGAPADPLGELRRAIEFWHGMCDVKLEIDESIDSLVRANPELGETVLVTCMEMINNAIRHGKATRLHLTIAAVSFDLLTITAINNGEPLREFERGLGMSMFDELTVHWSISSDGPETTVSAYIAARTTPASAQLEPTGVN